MNAVLPPWNGAIATERDLLYQHLTERFGGALARTASGYEADPDARRDLLQDLHAAQR